MTLYQGLISFHFQEPVADWTRAVAALPAYTIVKSVDNIGLLVEAQQVNAGPHFRKWADVHPGQHYDGADMATKRRRAREFFETFAHDPALMQLRRLVISLWNEVYANSQTADETADRVEQEQAFVDVWQAEYAARFPFGHPGRGSGHRPSGRLLSGLSRLCAGEGGRHRRGRVAMVQRALDGDG